MKVSSPGSACIEPTEEEFESVRREFGLHELAVEDAIKAHQRPKLEFYGDSLFVVLKTARWIDSEERIEFGEILAFVGDGFIISVRHGETALHDVRLQMEQRPELLAHGPSAALYAIVDRVVDDYEPVIEELDSAIRETETDVFSPSGSNPAGRIYQLKRAVLEQHTAVAPLVPARREARHHRAPAHRRGHAVLTSGTSMTICCGRPAGWRASVSCSRASWRRI